jgi:hypothetical protein
MPALLINLKIDLQEKFDILKATIADLTGLFEECHVKIRGTYSKECVEYILGKLGNEVNFYQELQESDWVAATSVFTSSFTTPGIKLIVLGKKVE